MSVFKTHIGNTFETYILNEYILIYLYKKIVYEPINLKDQVGDLFTIGPMFTTGPIQCTQWLIISPLDLIQVDNTIK
jgi:hypothetical protein